MDERTKQMLIAAFNDYCVRKGWGKMQVPITDQNWSSWKPADILELMHVGYMADGVPRNEIKLPNIQELIARLRNLGVDKTVLADAIFPDEKEPSNVSA